MRRRDRDEIGFQGNFTEIPAGDFKLRIFVRYIMYVLIDTHRFNDELLSCILSLLPQERMLPIITDIARISPDVLDDDEDLGGDIRNSILLETGAYIPSERTVKEFLLAVWLSSSRKECVRRIKDELAQILKTDGFEALTSADPTIRQKALYPLIYSEPVSRIADIFSLTREDIDILIMYFTKINFGLLSDIMEGWTHNELITALSMIFCVSSETILDRLMADKPLLQNAILEDSTNRRGYTFNISDEIIMYLSFPGGKSMYDRECSLDEKAPCQLASFHVNSVKENTAIDLLRAPARTHILLYGKEGTGKTEYARALAKAAGKTLYVFRQDGGMGKYRGKDDLFRLSLVTSSNDAKDTILLVDEAEPILSTQFASFLSFFGGGGNGHSKGRLNNLLDNAKCPIIWIVNHIGQIDASTKRRFTYSIEFTALPPRAIREHTVNKLAPFGLAASTVEDIATIAARSGLNAASVTFLAESISALPEEMRRDTPEARSELLRRVRALFDSNTRLITGTIPFRAKTGSTYSLDALNTSVDATKIVEAISRYYDAEERGLDLETGLRILLYGESGTGKTEFARYIADTLGRPLLIKRASDILSPWVGISEQQVAEIFREAEETRSILLLDEADSFFSSRENATRNWERTLVNEFLTRMEDFRGVLLCATNAPASLDRAVMRRFHEAVEFYTLSAEGITELLERYFPEVPFTDNQILDLFVNGSLTPGDFAALRGRLNFHPITADAAYITESLAELSKARRGE